MLVTDFQHATVPVMVQVFCHFNIKLLQSDSTVTKYFLCDVTNWNFQS